MKFINSLIFCLYHIVRYTDYGHDIKEAWLMFINSRFSYYTFSFLVLVLIILLYIISFVLNVILFILPYGVVRPLEKKIEGQIQAQNRIQINKWIRR